MTQPSKIALLMAHLMDEAVREYSANRFLIIAKPHLDRVGLRFKVPYGTDAKRPAAPPEHIRPARWDEVVADVINDTFDQLHQTWRWPAEPDHEPADLERMAQERSQRTGEIIAVR